MSILDILRQELMARGARARLFDSYEEEHVSSVARIESQIFNGIYPIHIGLLK